jgi:hypothetical protein
LEDFIVAKLEVFLHRNVRYFMSIVIIFSMVSTLLPSTFARAMTSETYWGGLYPQSLLRMAVHQLVAKPRMRNMSFIPHQTGPL